MTLLSNLFKNKKQSYIISVYENYITINDKEIVFPAHLNTLIEIFGKPSQQEYKLLWNVVWDDIGVYCDYGSWDNILNINFLQSKMDKIEFAPSNFFQGKLLVNNENLIEKDFDTIECKKIAVQRMRYKRKGDSFGFSVGMNFNYKEEISKDKYMIKPSENSIKFKDFNFKLAVIQELMYNQEVLKPKFDLFEFEEWYQERKIDTEKEGYEFIPEITQYFEKLPIESTYANLITEIYQDGGNEIYMQLFRFWTGEDDIFNIQNAEDAIHFPNLKKVTLFYENQPKVKNEFMNMNIKVDYL